LRPGNVVVGGSDREELRLPMDRRRFTELVDLFFGPDNPGKGGDLNV
jgi:hypothetical protein